MSLQQPGGAGSAWSRIGGWVAALALLLALGGCKSAIYSHMAEPDANDTLYTLLQGGVDAEKRLDAEGGYSIWVEKDELARALGLLKANAQPESKHPSLGELFGRNQLISTPAEERIRFVYGIEQALAQTLSKIDGVLVARVHIVLPANDPLASEVKPSSASIFIKHRAGQDLRPAVPAIKDLVVRGIEGLSVDRVAVTLFAASATRSVALDTEAPPTMPANSASFMGVAVPQSSLAALTWRFALGAAVVALLWSALLRSLRKARRRRLNEAAASPGLPRFAQPVQE